MTELQKLGHQQQAQKLKALWQTRTFRQQIAEGQKKSGRTPTEKTLLCTQQSKQYIIN